MTIPAAANGWPLVTMPDPWGFTQMDWKLRVPVTANVSPYTGQTQVIKWPGADGMFVTVTLPPLTPDSARAWTGFLWAMQGGSVACLLGDPLRRTPKGSAKPASSSGIMVSGTNAAGGLVLNLRGFAANSPRVLMSGDLLQINYRLYQVMNQYVNADSSGAVSLTVCPSLREVLTDGMPVTTHDAQGMFRLAKSESAFSIDQNKLYSMSIPLVEAR